MVPLFIHLRSIDTLAANADVATGRSVGGKASRLAWLKRHGFDIPLSWVVDADVFRRVVQRCLPPGLDPRSLIGRVGEAQVLQAMARAREVILDAPVEAELADELGALWTHIEPDAPWGLAVRSSATCEDDARTSMAGLASSLLGVRGRQALLDAVRQVWASAMLPRALSHLASRGVPDIAMAVVVQVVVAADASGVMFTRPPPGVDGSQWAPDERLVNATLGLGAPVADGAVAPDMIRFAARTGELRGMTLAHKSRALVVGAGGSELVNVADDRADEPAISTHALAQLSSIAERLESIDPCCHDVEFAVERGKVLIVQSRPAVGVEFPEGGDGETVWSRANVGEALPGVATPLTWSVARGFSERGFRQAFGSLGCKVPLDVPLVASVHGRFYLNLTQFMRIAAQVPGLDPRTLTQLGGGDGTALLERQVKGVSRKRFYARLPITAARLMAEQLTLSHRVDRYINKTAAKLRCRGLTDLSAVSNVALAEALRQTLRDLEASGTLMLACASSSLAGHLALKTWLSFVANGEAEQVAQVLSAGLAELESARPGIAIAHIAELARGECDVAQGFRDSRYRRVGDIPDGQVRRALDDFVRDFGHRALREAELATPRWREDPGPVFSMIASALRMPAEQAHNSLARARLASDAEMARLDARLGRSLGMVLRALTRHARNTMEMRERMRAWVTRSLGEVRAVAIEIDQRLRLVDNSIEPGSVFFCTVDELLGALASGRSDLGNVVKLRSAVYARDKARPDAPVTFVGKPPPGVLPPLDNKGILRGLPASSGVVEGIVRVLAAGQELEGDIRPGEILVAHTTDVGLTPLFLVAAGVVTELGGPLSHAALVAREYGVPAVVNVAGATIALRTGERVRVDGTHGTVQRMPSKD